MDSPTTHADPARGLGSRQRVRLAAVALWCSFLGAILLLLAVLALVPPDDFGFAEASVAFLCGWAITLIPVTLALSLCGPHDGR